MIKVSLARTIQTAPYEMMRFEVELDSDELLVADSPKRQAFKLHIMALGQVCAFEVLNGHMTCEEAKARLGQARQFYGVPEVE